MFKLVISIVVLIFIAFAISGCKQKERESTDKTTKSYSPKNVTYESLPEEKVEIKEKTAEEKQTVTKQEPEKEFNFRNTYWGMSKKQVKKSEKSTFVDEDASRIFYKGKVGNMNALIHYNFVDNKLWQATYLFEETYLNADNYVRDYKNLLGKLRAKYGEPIHDKSIWSSDSAKRNWGNNPGMGVETGNLKMVASWDLPDSKIHVLLHGENFEATLGIQYRTNNPELKKLVKEKEQKKVEKEF